jgi:hypothetical protein
MKKYIVPIIHLIIFLIAITSPFWIDWRIVLVGAVLYELQLFIFKGCVLSFWQFGSKDGKPKERFIIFYLKHIFPRLKTSRLNLMLDLIIPIAVPIFAILMQVLLNLSPIINIS